MLYIFIIFLFNSSYIYAEDSNSLELLWNNQLQSKSYELSLHSSLTVDDNENIYIPTNVGFVIYSSAGEYVKDVTLPEGVGYHKVSNIVYSNEKIILVTKNWPGSIHIYNIHNNEFEQHINIVTDSTPQSLFFISEIGLTKNKNFLYFATQNPNRIYRFNLKTYNLDYYDLDSIDTVYKLGTHVAAPLPLSDDSVLFTTSKGYIEKFIYDNSATNIFTERFSDKFYKVKLRSAYRVPFTITKNYIFYIYDNYICKFDINRGTSLDCMEYLDYSKKEGVSSANFISDSNENLYFIMYKKFSNTTKYAVVKYNSDLQRQWEIPLSYGNKGALFIDAFDNLFVSAEDLFKVNTNTGEIEYTYELEKPPDSAFIQSSLITPTTNDNYYLFYQRKSHKQDFYYLYKFKGSSKKEVECVLSFYCDSIPKHNPVILVHGLGGHYSQWFDTKRAIVRDKIFEDFKKDDPEYPKEWLYAYSYGINFTGDYDYQGKIENISTNMHSVVEQLAKEHKLAGGDGKVDIIAYSLGGLVARHYILEKTGYPGVQNLNVDHKIDKLILVASPVNGSSWMTFNDAIPSNTATRKLVDQLVYTGEELFSNDRLNIQKDVGTQLSRESSYIQNVSKSILPSNIEYFRSYADIKVKVGYNLFSSELVRTISFGDVLVFPEDTNLPINFTESNVESHTIAVTFVPLSSSISGLDLIKVKNLYHQEFMTNSKNIQNILNYLLLKDEK